MLPQVSIILSLTKHKLILQMPNFTYQELLNVYKNLKTTPNIKVSAWDHTNGIITQLELSDRHFNVIHAAAKRLRYQNIKMI